MAKASTPSDQATRLQLFTSQILVVVGLFFAQLLSPLFPQPVVPWPKTQNGDERNGLRGTTTVVTGANSGLGFAIAQSHFQRGSHVFLACRSAKRALNARSELLKAVADGDPALLEVLSLDTSSLSSVRSCAKALKEQKIDYLFLNAGIVGKADDADRITQDGLEVVYETNFLGHFLLVNLLLDQLSDTARIVVTASAGAITAEFDRNLPLKSKKAEEPGFHYNKRSTSWLHLPGTSMPRYNSTKAMQVVFTRLLQKRFDKEAQTSSAQRRRTITAYHPGFVLTTIFTTFSELRALTAMKSVLWLASFVALTPTQGARTALWLAHTQEAEAGRFYDRKNKLTIPFYLAPDNQKTGERLWQRWNNDAGLTESDWTIKLSK